MRCNGKLAGVLVGVVFLVACGKAKPPPPSPAAHLVGDVTDVSGARVADVQVTLGTAAATTGAEGRFDLTLSPLAEAVVLLKKDGFVASSRRLALPENSESYLNVTLMPLAAPQPLPAATGGKVTGARNAALEAPADAFVTASGAAVTGEVQVHLTPYDPAIAAESLAYPGELRGLTSDGEQVPLKTYGVVDVTVTQGGQALQVKPGKTITVRAPMTSKGDVPANMGMWRYDAAQSLWLELPAGVWDAATRTWSTTLGPGFALDSPVNEDLALNNPTCIEGVLLTSDWDGVSYATVTAREDPDFGVGRLYSTAWPTLSSTFCMTVERNTRILLRVEEVNGRVTERRFTSGSRVNRDYPDSCDRSACKQLTPIIVGSADPGDGVAACTVTAEQNPFSTSCAPDLGTFTECFNPQGKCTSETDPGLGTGMPSSAVTYENGARMESGFETPGGYVSRYYGPDGRLCATVTAEGAGARFAFPNGREVTVTMNDDGSTTMKCGAASFTMDAAQVAAMSGCGGGQGGDSSGCTPKPGTFNGKCTFSTECSEGLDCCGTPFHPAEKLCTLDSLCELLCEEDFECYEPHLNMVCCGGLGGAKVCLPSNACQ